MTWMLPSSLGRRSGLRREGQGKVKDGDDVSQGGWPGSVGGLKLGFKSLVFQTLERDGFQFLDAKHMT